MFLYYHIFTGNFAGYFLCGYSGKWTPGLGNPRQPENMGRRFEHDIAFPTPFREPPVVFLSITGLDHDNDNNLRFLTQVEHVSKSGFRAVCFTWAETIIYNAKIRWLAISTYNGETTREFYCGDSDSRTWLPAYGNPQYPRQLGYQYLYQANFPTEVNYTPVILPSVTYLDVDRFSDARFLAQVINVTRSWLKATCYAWSGTRIFEMRVSLLILPPYGRIGEFFCYHSNNWDLVGYPGPNGRQSVHDVRFPVRFSRRPGIFLTVTYMNNFRGANLRFYVRVLNVSESGFSAACYTWLDTIIHEMRVTWLALYQEPA